VFPEEEQGRERLAPGSMLPEAGQGHERQPPDEGEGPGRQLLKEGKGQERQLLKEGEGQGRLAPGSSLPGDQQERERPDSVQPSEKDRRKAERRQRKGSRKRKHNPTMVSKNFAPTHAALPTSFETGAFRSLTTSLTTM
jgi:hypothetical protein